MKTIFITGASSGIGKATVKYFAKKGWNVIASMRSPEKETELNYLGNVMVLRMDVENKDTMQDAVIQGIQRFGEIDVLLNNAGYGTIGIFESAMDEQIKRQFDVNVFGLMNMTKVILPHFRANKAGIVINISSMGGKVAFPASSLYSATKFAVEGFSESLAYELATQNIQVKLIEPGSIITNFDGAMDILFDESLTSYKQYSDVIIAKMTQQKGKTAGRTSPEVVAEVIYQAATDGTNQLRYIAGEDAKAIIKMKQELSDEEFMKNITQLVS